jgi:hypothetical protein
MYRKKSQSSGIEKVVDHIHLLHVLVPIATLHHHSRSTQQQLHHCLHGVHTYRDRISHDSILCTARVLGLDQEEVASRVDVVACRRIYVYVGLIEHINMLRCYRSINILI